MPAWEALPYELLSPAPEVAARRAATVRRLREAAGPLVVVAPVLAAMQAIAPTRAPSPRSSSPGGDELAPDALAAVLLELGYERVDVVEHRGEFAARGGVLDLFPADERRPVRLEFWGDDVEEIRRFVPSTQLSREQVERVSVDPARELVLDDATRDRASRAAAALDDERLRDLLARMAEGLAPDGAESAAAFVADRMSRPPSCCPRAAGWSSPKRDARCRVRRRRRLTPTRSRPPSAGRGLV